VKRKGIEKLHENALYKAILELKTLEECRSFFTDLCTPSEIADFCDRWQVAQMLVQDTPYREIAAKTGVSTTTIGRVARFLHDGNGGYKTVLGRQGKL
jgi:TrpR-related protein YerC/YecD